MTRLQSGLAFAAAALLLSSAGCASKIRYEKSDTVTAGETKFYEIDGPTKQQRVKIEISSDEKIFVRVFLKKDRSSPDAKPLGETQGTKDASVEVDIPEGETFVIVVDGAGKKASYTIRVNSV